jgi:hypothetical protein
MFTGLTRKGCRMVSSATVARLVPEAEADTRDQGPDHEAYDDEASCVWKHDINDPSIMRKLVVGVNVQLEADDVDLPQDQPVDPVQRVKAAMDKVRREDQQVANRTKRLPWGDTAYYGSLTEPSGIGDAAVEFSEHVRSEDGLLDPETVTITARLANAEISVQYSSGESRGTLMSPTPEPTVRELAEVVARELVDGLKKCAECAR